MKRALRCVLAGVAMLASVPCSAQWFMGVAAGRSEVSPATRSRLVASEETHDNAHRLFAGYSFSERWGIEAQYLDLGRYQATSAIGTSGKVEVTGWSVAGVARFPVGESFALFGKLGAGRFVAKATYLDSTNESIGGTLPVIGVGVECVLSKSWRATLEYEDHGRLAFGQGRARLNMWSIGLVYRW